MSSVPESTPPSGNPRSGKKNRKYIAIAIAVLVVLIVAVAALVIKNKLDKEDRRTDMYYCTLSGVTLLDRAPNTGLTCAELLYGDD